jgi:hypothetical protein
MGMKQSAHAKGPSAPSELGAKLNSNQGATLSAADMPSDVGIAISTRPPSLVGGSESRATMEVEVSLTDEPSSADTQTPDQRARAILDILAAGRLLEDEDVRQVCDMLMSCDDTHAMWQVRAAVDEGLRKANMGSLFHFVFDILLERERKQLLDHFEHVASSTESNKCSPPRGANANAGIVVVSDVDDTVVASLKDRRLSPNTLYPGVRAFYLELSTARCSPPSNDMQEQGDLTQPELKQAVQLHSSNEQPSESGIGVGQGTDEPPACDKRTESTATADTQHKESHELKQAAQLHNSNEQPSESGGVGEVTDEPACVNRTESTATTGTQPSPAPMAPTQPIIFVTARPGWMRGSTSRSLVAHGFVDSVVLSGTTTGFISSSSMINRKVHHVSNIKRFFPNHALLFIGDNGQLDIDISAQLIRRDLVVGALIHDVFSALRSSRKSKLRAYNSEVSQVTDTMEIDLADETETDTGR